MGALAILNAVAQFDGFGTLITQNANLIKGPGNFMTLVEAPPNMVGAHGMMRMNPPNRLALKWQKLRQLHLQA